MDSCCHHCAAIAGTPYVAHPGRGGHHTATVRVRAARLPDGTRSALCDACLLRSYARERHNRAVRRKRAAWHGLLARLGQRELPLKAGG